MKKIHMSVASSVALSLLIAAGCSSTPKMIPELEAARSEIQQVSSDPLAQEAAGIRLKQANEALQRADEGVRKGEAMKQIQQDSSLALGNAKIAKEQVAEMKARKAVEAGEAERNSVLLAAREKELRDAQLEADRVKQQANQQIANANDKASSAVEEAARMKAELAALQAKQTDRGMVLTLGDVLFATGQATLQPGAMRVIDQLGTFMGKYPDAKITVEGHTDSMGSDAFNLDLSQRRADSVRAAVTSRGVDGTRIVARGLGESLPVASNTDAAGRQQNRRVEIVFADSAGGAAAQR
jgi:outer membrane protein OmpA-like peptidoglycan-associated protein